MWTIYDIAREAGVSAKTVSRVLNGKPGVSKETRTRILDIMQRVNYHAHIGAQSLRNKRSGCIGVTLPAPMNVVPISQGFFMWLFVKLYELFGAKGDYIGFDLNPFSGSQHTDYGRGIWQQLFKACVVAGPLAVDDQVIGRIHQSGVPYVALGRLDGMPECSCATVDYEEGACISTKFLLDRGHKRIAMLKAFAGFQPGAERRRGYLRALNEAGLDEDPSLIRSARFDARNIANVVHRLLTDSSVTALIDCSATEDGTSLREGARRAGRIPGKDFEIVAWTYADNAAVLSEASAHLWLPVVEAAAEGLEQLSGWLNGEREGPINVVFHPVLYTRWAQVEVPKPKRLFDLLD